MSELLWSQMNNMSCDMILGCQTDIIVNNDALDILFHF